MASIRRTVAVPPGVGLHARPAALFVKSAAGFTASIRLRLGEKEVDGKSILGVMQLGATGGTTIEIVADGDDAEVALNTLARLVAGFAEG